MAKYKSFSVFLLFVKGNIFAIGGNLELAPQNPIIGEIRDRFLSKRLVIISTASSDPDKAGKKYSFIFNTFGIDTYVISAVKREEADREKYAKIIRESGGVFFTGGNQMRLTSIIGGTEIHYAIAEKMKEEDFIVIGTSAGAAAMPETMIAYSEPEEALSKGAVKLSPGLGFVSGIIIDTHLISRNRIWRLLQVVAENPKIIGIGLAENTGILINKRGESRVVGEGVVVIVDGEKITYTNIPEIRDGEVFTVKNIMVDLLTHGQSLNLPI